MRESGAGKEVIAKLITRSKNILEEHLLRYAVRGLGSLKLVAEKLEVDYSTQYSPSP